MGRIRTFISNQSKCLLAHVCPGIIGLSDSHAVGKAEDKWVGGALQSSFTEMVVKTENLPEMMGVEPVSK